MFNMWISIDVYIEECVWWFLLKQTLQKSSTATIIWSLISLKQVFLLSKKGFDTCAALWHCAWVPWYLADDHKIIDVFLQLDIKHAYIWKCELTNYVLILWMFIRLLNMIFTRRSFFDLFFKKDHYFNLLGYTCTFCVHYIAKYLKLHCR